MIANPLLNSTVTADRLELAARGPWTAAHAEVLERLVDAAAPQVADAERILVDLAGVEALDTIGAWLLERLIRRSGSVGEPAEITGLSSRYRGLIDEMRAVNLQARTPPKAANRLVTALDGVGRTTVRLAADLMDFLAMFGEISVAVGRVVLQPRRLRLTSTVYQLYRVAWQAVPIMVLITFLIGGIIAQQGIFHFRKFGADAYVVDMVGILVLREIGVLLVSIMIAGRSGSSYTAELGAMKMREEITRAGLEFQGLTGVPVISLLGGDVGASVLAASKTQPAIIAADPSAGQSMTEAARQALRKLDALLADNSDSLHSAIANLNAFTGALARNSDRVDGILTALEHMAGGGAPKSTPATYDLTAPGAFPPPREAPTRQLVVPEPTTLVTLDTQRIMVDPSAGGPLDNAQWTDSLPKLLQEKIIQSFEASNYVGAVARPMDGLAADYQILIDLRSFNVTGPSAAPVARVQFAAKILGDAGRIVGSRSFEAMVPVKDVNAAGAAEALDKAFGETAISLVEWTGTVM
jgi:ABC-type uncharacterized transport system auxiliary subunit